MLDRAGAGGEHDRERERGRPARRSRFVGNRHVQESPNAIEQRSTRRRDREAHRPGPPRFELRERFRVRDGIATQRHRDVVAAMLALDTNPRREPPHRGMVEEQCLHDRLQQVDQIIVAADMRELVRENRLDLRRRQRGDRGDRQQNRRPQPADERRDVDARRFDHVRGGGQAETVRQAPARRLPPRCGRGEGVMM